MAGAPVFFFVEETGHHRVFGKRLQSERRDELGCVVRHHGKNLVTLLHQQTSKLSGFVSGDRTGDAKDDCLPRAAQPHNFARRAFFNSLARVSFHSRSTITFGLVAGSNIARHS